MVNLTKNTILIISSLSNHSLKGSEHFQKTQISWIFHLSETVVLIILKDKFAQASLKKGRIRKDQFTAFEFVGIRRQQIFHQPGKIFRFHMVNILRDVSFHRIDIALELRYGIVLKLDLAGCTIFHATKAAFRSMNFV